MKLWGANHPNYSVISTPTMSVITPFGMVCTLHFLQCIIVRRYNLQTITCGQRMFAQKYAYKLQFTYVRSYFKSKEMNELQSFLVRPITSTAYDNYVHAYYVNL